MGFQYRTFKTCAFGRWPPRTVAKCLLFTCSLRLQKIEFNPLRTLHTGALTADYRSTGPTTVYSGEEWDASGVNYGTASGSARGFAQHHSQQLSRAAVCGDAQNINNAARNMRVPCRALIHDRSQCPTPLRAGLLGPRVVSPHPQGLQGSHLNLSQTSAQTDSAIGQQNVFSSQ